MGSGEGFAHGVGRGEVGAVAGFDGEGGEGDGEVGATARWVLPHPGWPKKLMGRFTLMNRSVARPKMSLRSTDGWKSKSNSSMVRR